ncbi:hypothetical protein JCM8208_002601 [Rhodotorula glutinis]
MLEGRRTGWTERSRQSEASSLAVTANQVIYYLKKAFKFYQRWQKKHKQSQGQQQQQQQQQHGQSYSQHAQQQQQHGYPQQGQSPYPVQAPHQQPYQSSPYPQAGHAPQQQQHHQQGGYGAHDGRPTARALARRHDELARAVVESWSAEVAGNALRRESRLTLAARSPSPFVLFPRLSSSSLAFPASTFAPLFPSTRPARLTWPTSTFPTSTLGLPPSPLLLSLRPFSTSRHSRSRPFRPPPSFYDPSSPNSHPSHRVPRPGRLASLPDLHIFHLLPSYLRPSYHVLLCLLGLSGDQNADMANAQNSQYVELRNLAIREGDLMAKAFSASKQAYTAGDGASAHDLSVQGKEHQRNKDRYNDQAAAWIFNENNKVQPPGSIDLHGLYVQEAIEYTERAIADGRNKGMPELRVIVGKGNHSPSHVAKIKPAITDLMQREHLTATLDPHNGGVLVVQLQGQGGGKGSGQFLRELEGSKDNDCVVM